MRTSDRLALCAASAPDEPSEPLQTLGSVSQPRRQYRAAAASAALAVGGLLGGGSVLSRLGLGAAPAYAAPEPAPIEAPAPGKLLSAGQRKRLKLQFKSKLAKVPCFMVTNEGGSPFLNRLASGDQSALMFIFPAEAERMLEGVLKAPNGASSGARVFPTNLDRAFKLARIEPMQSGLRDQVTNRELTMVWQFMPHAAEQRAAQLLMAKSAKLGPPAVPCYTVDGLVLTKRGKEVRPVFLSKKDCDAAIANLGEEAEGVKVQVHDALALFLSIAQDIEAGEPGVEEELNSLEIVPPSISIHFREYLKKDKVARPPKIVPPNPNAGY